MIQFAKLALEMSVSKCSLERDFVDIRRKLLEISGVLTDTMDTPIFRPRSDKVG